MKLNRGPEGEHGTLGVELTEVSSHSTPSLRNGVAWCARRHTSSRFVEGSGLSPVRNIPDDEKLSQIRHASIGHPDRIAWELCCMRYTFNMLYGTAPNRMSYSL